ELLLHWVWYLVMKSPAKSFKVPSSHFERDIYMFIPVGRDVEFIKVGDIVSVPFNIACGRCRSCKEGHTGLSSNNKENMYKYGNEMRKLKWTGEGVCLNVNPARPGA